MSTASLGAQRERRIDHLAVQLASPVVAERFWSKVKPAPAEECWEWQAANTLCVNPWHLEPVTQPVNLSRQVSGNGSKTHCKRGHELCGDNLGRQNGGHRYCKTCKRLTDARRWAA